MVCSISKGCFGVLSVKHQQHVNFSYFTAAVPYQWLKQQAESFALAPKWAKCCVDGGQQKTSQLWFSHISRARFTTDYYNLLLFLVLSPFFSCCLPVLEKSFKSVHPSSVKSNFEKTKWDGERQQVGLLRKVFRRWFWTYSF